ncbi:diguanylate cyclase domain-containing protein [Roseibium sp.]|uniref:diguanylate cyclase domain-containing protein n=1 Tax=Roseibium sp. TaxID=1936156 RepID=UPI003BAA9588
MFERDMNAGAAGDTDTVRSATGRQIKVWIYGLAALLIAMSAASLTFIAHLAWVEADRRSLESEKLRFSGNLDAYTQMIAIDQFDLAQWDDTFTALQTPADRAFIKDQLVLDLWETFDLERTFVVATDGTLIAQAVEDHTRFPEKKTEAAPVLRQLAERTRAAFEDRKRRSNSAFADWYLPQSVLLDVSISEFAIVDGQPALLVAVPVLPDYGDVDAKDDYPAVLINAVYVDETMVAELNETLGFRDLRYIAGQPEWNHPTNQLIRAADGTVIGYFRWDQEKPGHQIWLMALPLILLMTVIISTVAFAAAAKISRLSSQLEESERKNHHFANHDTLTGLPNRHHFSDRLAYSIDSLPDKGFALFACDLDRFKPINDTYGHEAGDKVLCVVADRFKRQFSEDSVVCRIGGDEFIVLVTKYESANELMEIAESLRTSMSVPIEIGGGNSVQIGVSVGIATAPECGLNDKDLIRLADLALYRAKENGRNTVEFASPRTLHAGNADLSTAAQSKAS